MTRTRLIGGVALVFVVLLGLTILRPTTKEITPPARGPSVSRCPNANAAPGSISERKVRDAVICLINAERVKHHLRAMRYNATLYRASHLHAVVMVKHNVFAHETRYDGSPGSRARRVRYVPRYGRWRVGEDLGEGSGSYGTPRAIVRAWMNSPPHRAQILTRRYRDIAVGSAPGSPIPGDSDSDAADYVVNFGFH